MKSWLNKLYKIYNFLLHNIRSFPRLRVPFRKRQKICGEIPEHKSLNSKGYHLEDMPKPIKEYTDKELEKAIKVHETEIRKDKETKCSDEDSKRELAKGIKMKQEHLQKLYAERDERRKKSKKDEIERQR